MNNLFENGKRIEALQRKPERPLRTVSDFVVQGLPQMLVDIAQRKLSPGDLANLADDLVFNQKGVAFGGMLNRRNKELAGLDVKMLEAGIVNAGGIPGRHLSNLVDQLSQETGMKPSVTYEDVIFINPLQTDPRLFTQGLIGRSERDFYLGHRLLEDSLSQAVSRCNEASQILSDQGKGGVRKATQLITEASQIFKPVTSYTNHIGSAMSEEAFKVFRQYLRGNPQRGLVGPSGKFTSGIPTLDFLLGGAPIEKEYSKLDEELGYYPRGGQKDIQRARIKAQRGQSLIDLSRGLGNPPEIFEPIVQMSRAIREFRGAHLKAVRHQVPEALTDEASGTGGEASPGKFLRARLAIHHVPSRKEDL